MRRSGERSQSCSGGGKNRAAWTNFNTKSNRKEDEGEGEQSNAKHKKKGDIRHNKRLHSVVLHESHLVARGQAQG